MKTTLDREFIERKVNVRQIIPVSIGDSDGNRIPEVAMTYGEVAPQVYRSRVETPQVAWSITFGRHRHVSTQELGRTGTSLFGRKPDPVAHANTSVAAQSLPGGHNYLMIRVPVDQYAATRTLLGGFGTTDLIGTDPTLHRRVIQWITGR